MNTWLNLAFRISRRSKHPKQRMAAVVVLGGRVLSLAVNSPRWGHHAELRAIARATCTAGATMVVSRSTGDGLAKPCVMCAKAIRAAGFARVVYSTATGYLEELL